MKDTIINEISERMEEFDRISRYLYENPEQGNKEYKAAKLLTEYFLKNGFEVEKNIYGLETSFRASYDSGKEGAHLAFFCEYDALPQIGHGCGHNLISAMSAGAALGLKAVLDKTGGKVTVFGTQAEENDGVKGVLAEKGAFKGVTAAMMAHPSPVTEESGSSLAIDGWKYEFFGKTAHAAAAPEKGINALDGAILLFNGINALRQHVTSDVRIHGIISQGGAAPNIVPDYAEARFYIRAGRRKYLEEVVAKVRNIAEGAAAMTGATVKISEDGNPYDDLLTNRTLSDAFTKNLKDLGEGEVHPGGSGLNSIDIGNVSYVVPVIHPWIGLDDPTLLLHSKEFADCTVTDKGKDAVYRGACALAATAYDVIVSAELRQKMKEEFERRERG